MLQVPNGVPLTAKTTQPIAKPIVLGGGVESGAADYYALEIDSATAVRTLNTLLKGGLTRSSRRPRSRRAAPASGGTVLFDDTTAGVIGPTAQAAGLTLRRVATAPAQLEDIDRSPRIAVFTNAVDQSVWSLRNLGFTADPVGTTALNGASDPLVSYDVVFSTANYPANTPGTPCAGAAGGVLRRGGGYSAAARRRAVHHERRARGGLTTGTRSGNGRSGIVFWDNTGGAASPITGVYPSRDTAIVDPPTWFTAVPSGWSIDANLPIAGFFAAGLLADRRRVGVGARAPMIARDEHDARGATPGRVRVQPALPRGSGARVARPRLGRVLGGRRIGIDTTSTRDGASGSESCSPVAASTRSSCRPRPTSST